jgi:hypothetical protein
MLWDASLSSNYKKIMSDTRPSYLYGDLNFGN